MITVLLMAWGYRLWRKLNKQFDSIVLKILQKFRGDDPQSGKLSSKKYSEVIKDS